MRARVIAHAVLFPSHIGNCGMKCAFVCTFWLTQTLLSVPAGVHMALAYGASEEALTAVAAGGSIVFSGGLVSTDGTITADSVWTD